MLTVFDVAHYILNKLGPMTAMKLQKLVYYSQAWSLVWDEEPLFPSKIEAWANGPVVRDLYNQHRGLYKIETWPDVELNKFSDAQIETLDSVIESYGDKNSQWLSDLTHKESPWINSRKGLAPGERGEQEITHASMMEYYSSL